MKSKVKSFLSNMAYRVVLSSVFLASHQTILKGHRWRTSSSYGVSVYFPAFAGTQWLTGYISRQLPCTKTLSHPSKSP